MKYLIPILLTSVFYLYSPNSIYAQYSLSFSGDNAYVEIDPANAIDFENSFTVEFWVKADDLSKRFPVFSTRLGNHGGAFEIEVGTGFEGSGRVSVTGLDTWIFDSEDNKISEGEWAHIAYVRWGNGENDQAIYVNGKSVSEHLKSNYSITNNSEPYRLASNGGENFNGNVDELRIWETARTQDEIRANMLRVLTGEEQGLAGYWQFDEGSGTTTEDSAANGNNGTLHGGADWSSDTTFHNDHYSLYFFTDGYAEIEQNTPIDFHGDFTVEFWVKVEDLSERYPVFSTRLNNHSGAFQIEVGPGSSSSGQGRVSVTGLDTWMFESKDHAISEGEWTHIAYTRGTVQKLYINGVAVPDHQRNAYDVTNNSEPLRLAYAGTGNSMHGYIDELRIWNSVRSASEIHSYMSNPLVGNEAHLTGYWRFNTGTGSSIYDLTSNGNHGTRKLSTEWSTDLPTASVSGITGIEFVADAGDHNISLEDDFNAFGLTFSPNDLTLDYNSSENKFSIYGSAWVSLDGHDIILSMGTASSPGISIIDNELSEFNLGITTHFTLYELDIDPAPITFRYNASDQKYQLYGSVILTIEDETINANLGSESNPGMIIEGGTVEQVNFGITEDFSLGGLIIHTENLGMEWVKGDDSNQYHIYGSADFSVEGQSMGASFGDPSSPGIVMEGSKLKSMDIAINSDIHLGNIELIAKDLRVNYQESSQDIFVTGGAEIKEIFELKFNLGDGSDGKKGLVIDRSGIVPKFKVEDLTIELDHADLGTIDLKNFRLHFDENGIIESDVEVVFAGGDGFGGTIKFTDTNPVELEEIAIFYVAENLPDAIEIFEGVQVNYMSGTLENLENPSDLKVSATTQVFFGDGFSIDGYSATMFQTEIATVIDKNSFSGSADMKMGAYLSDGWDDNVNAENSPDWDHLFGHGSSTFKIDFPAKKVTATIDIDNIPTSLPFLSMKAGLHLSENDVDFMGGVSASIPNVKLHFAGFKVDIKGRSIASADGALRYRYGDIHASYLAAWGDIDINFEIKHVKFTVGVKYNLGSKHVAAIGSGTIKTIKNEYHDDVAKLSNGGPPYSQVVHTFEIDQSAPNFILIDANWHQIKDTVHVTVMGPEGLYDLREIVVVDDSNENELPTLGAESNADLVTNDSLASFLLTPLTIFSEPGPENTTMTPGRYHVILSYPGSGTDSTTVHVNKIWNPPVAEIQVDKNSNNNYEIDLDYWSPIPDSTLLSIYVTDTLSTEGGKLITHLDADNFDEDNYGSATFEYTPDFVPDADTLYFYAVIEDRVNPPVKTAITEAHPHQSDISGIVQFPPGADSLESGLRVFLDENKNGSFDIESTGGLENFGITGDDGTFHITGVEQGSHELRIVLPQGYRIAGTDNRYGHIDLNFNGTPVQLNIEIETYTENES